MKAEETMMTPLQLYAIWKKHDFYDIKQLMRLSAEAQAKISFKAGYDKALAQLADMTEECKQIGRNEVVETTQEMVRLLGKVVPADQNDMIRWAVKSQDSVYTNAGAAYRIGQTKLTEWGIK